MKKTFDLNKALAGELVVTRDEREVKELHQFKTAKAGAALAGVIKGSVFTWYTSGAYRADGISVEDLFMKAPLVEIWVNIYQEGDSLWVGTPFPSEEAANNAKGNSTYTMFYVKTIKITNEI